MEAARFLVGKATATTLKGTVAVDQQLDQLRQRVDHATRHAERTRDQLVVEITAKIRAAFETVLADLREIRVSLDKLRELIILGPPVDA